MIAADARTAILFALSPGQDHDAPHGRQLLQRLGTPKNPDRGQQLRLESRDLELAETFSREGVGPDGAGGWCGSSRSRWRQTDGQYVGATRAALLSFPPPASGEPGEKAPGKGGAMGSLRGRSIESGETMADAIWLEALGVFLAIAAAWIVKTFGTWWASDVEQARTKRSARNLRMLELLEQSGAVGDTGKEYGPWPDRLRLSMQFWVWRAWRRWTPGGRWETKQYVKGVARMRQRHPELFE